MTKGDGEAGRVVSGSMLEGMPPNGASTVLRLVTDEKRARAVADIIVETFDPAETAAAAFEEPDGVDWAVEVFFGEPPEEGEVRLLIEAATDAATADGAVFSTHRAEGLGVERRWKASSRCAPGAWWCTARMTAQGSAPMTLASRSRRRWPSAPAITARPSAACWRWTASPSGAGPAMFWTSAAGTGVLAIAAARLLRQSVACGDIDPVSVATARANAAANRAGAFVRPVLAVGVRHAALQETVQRAGGYDLIFANILAKPLRLLAPSLAAVAAPGADLVLSGLLARDVPGVLSAYARAGVRTREERRDRGLGDAGVEAGRMTDFEARLQNIAPRRCRS